MLIDRLQKIESTVRRYGENMFAISFSGGKDSTVLSALVDLALPGNQIPRVYINTGIDLNMVRNFVFELSKKDSRVEIIKPQVAIKPMLEIDGYPFKSKVYAHNMERYQRIGMCPSIQAYLDGASGARNACPKKLRYQFTPEFSNVLKVSDKCCLNMKEIPLQNWGKANNRPIAMVGIMREEGGRRGRSQCLVFSGKAKKDINGIPDKFQPMTVVSKEWEEWFIKEYQVDICKIYYPPYNFDRTGCKGCPFALHLQHELDILEKFFPAERKQCELIWGPVYDEYKRIGYRLKDKKKSDIWLKFDDLQAYAHVQKAFEQISAKIPQGTSRCYIYLVKEHMYKPVSFDPCYTAALSDKLKETFGDTNVALVNKSVKSYN